MKRIVKFVIGFIFVVIIKVIAHRITYGH